jgi:recombination protein RecA
MAKKNTKNTETKGSGAELDLSKLANAVGGEILARMDTVRTWIDTGNLALNYACSGKFIGGGIPIGKLIEIWGNSSSCKTLFALNFIRGVQRLGGIPIFIDVENTINATFAERAAHVNTNGVVVIPVEKVDSLEKAFNQIHVVLREIEKAYGKDRPIVIVYDSIAASASEREFAETTIDMFNTSKEKKKEAGAGADKPGEHAKIIGKELRKLNPVLNRANASVVFINQIREKIGVMFGSNEKKATGGRSLEYYCSLSIKTKAYKKLKDERENVKGILVSVENTKNKCFRPFVAAPDNAHLLFDAGINPVGGLLDCLYKEYRIDKAVKEDGKPRAGYWKVRAEYTENGEDVVFQASMEKNVVPIEVLIQCPKLIDGESSEQVKDYLASFGLTLEASNAQYEEQEIQSGEELDAELAG